MCQVVSAVAGTLNIGDASDDWAYDEAGFDLDDSVILTEFIVKTPLVIVVRLNGEEEGRCMERSGGVGGEEDVQIGLDNCTVSQILAQGVDDVFVSFCGADMVVCVL